MPNSELKVRLGSLNSLFRTKRKQNLINDCEPYNSAFVIRNSELLETYGFRFAYF